MTVGGSALTYCCERTRKHKIILWVKEHMFVLRSENTCVLGVITSIRADTRVRNHSIPYTYYRTYMSVLRSYFVYIYIRLVHVCFVTAGKRLQELQGKGTYNVRVPLLR